MPIDIEELQIEGSATVTAIEAAPAIAGGEGSAVTGHFITRRVDEICRIQVLGADGTIDTIEGTTIHPIWSLDRDGWAPLGELQEGAQLQGASGPATILTHQVLQRTTPVYNIEIHGQHVYQVGALGILVHNANSCLVRFGSKAETAADLAADAAKAAENGFPHGVSTKLVQRVSGSDKAHRSAPLAVVAKHFTVEQTGKRISHYTVHLPKPVTDEVANLFNSIFVRR